MTQRQVDHDTPLPACRNGHTPRHIHDTRRQSAGGGHLVECPCGSTRKHPDFAAALVEWKRMHRIRTPRAKPLPVATIVQLGLRLPGGRRDG